MFHKARKAIQFGYKTCIRNKLPRNSGCLSLVLPLAYCSVQPPKKIELAEPANLTHSFLLKQASSVTVNSVSQLLNYTVAAIVDTAELYKKALKDVMSLLEESQAHIGNEHVQQELSDTMISYRAKINEYKSQILNLYGCASSIAGEKYTEVGVIEELQTTSPHDQGWQENINISVMTYQELESLFEYVEKVVVSATETSFLVGAEYASSFLSERLYSAKQEVSKEKKVIEDLERDYLDLQNTFIKYTSDEEKKKTEPTSS